MILAVHPGLYKKLLSISVKSLYIAPQVANTNDSKFNGTDIFIVFGVSSFHHHSFFYLLQITIPPIKAF